MTTDHHRLVVEDERDPMRELHELLRGDSSARARLRMPSELTWEPPTDVVETEGEIVVTVDIAGMEGKDISVVTDGATLRVRGTRRGRRPPERSIFISSKSAPVRSSARSICRPAWIRGRCRRNTRRDCSKCAYANSPRRST